MYEPTWKRNFLRVIVLCAVLPVAFYAMGNVPQRTFLKEALSLLTVLALFLLIAQFLFSRCSRPMFSTAPMSTITKIHKTLGYFLIPLLLVHPLLIVVPRYFEAGINSEDAFFTIITSVNNSGIVAGICAWIMMLALGITSLLRKHIFANYRSWRVTHAVLSACFIICASWHAVHLGRHMTPLLSTYLIVGVVSAVFILLKTYIPQRKIILEVAK